jgi:hypothetical protein
MIKKTYSVGSLRVPLAQAFKHRNNQKLIGKIKTILRKTSSSKTPTCLDEYESPSQKSPLEPSADSSDE